MFDIKGRHPHCSLKSVWLKYWQIFLYIQSFSSVSFVPAILAVPRWNSQCQFMKEIFIGDKKWIFTSHVVDIAMGPSAIPNRVANVSAMQTYYFDLRSFLDSLVPSLQHFVDLFCGTVPLSSKRCVP
jgi:hypothetical protein